MTLGTVLNYAFILRKAGRAMDALPHAQAAFTGYAQRFGHDYPVTLSARHSLSKILAELGQHAKAIVHAEKLVEGRTRVLGPEHPWTLEAQELLDEYRRGQSSI